MVVWVCQTNEIYRVPYCSSVSYVVADVFKQDLTLSHCRVSCLVANETGKGISNNGYKISSRRTIKTYIFLNCVFLHS